ncbi:MAG: NAD(P)H-hydrate dehydratase [Marinifilaceae bacterium]|jgi:NAD(P)H-hydrate epimerase|nr:NAD(P)H-hydrate dehydratase [Marinifilaceae bacterium]
MKIFSADQTKEIDQYTIKEEVIDSIDLMERASIRLFKWIRKRYDKQTKFIFFIGKGNNGGDGLALARLLSNANYKCFCYLLYPREEFSQDSKINFDRLFKINPKILKHYNINSIESNIDKNTVVIDAILGYGLKGNTRAELAKMIHTINKLSTNTISIDLPSGLTCENSKDNTIENTICAQECLSFEFPKFSLLLPENFQFVGKFHILDIELNKQIKNKLKSKNFYLQEKEIRKLLRRKNKFDHKGSYGHALLVSGSYGKIGAAILASKSCLKSGVGLLTCHTPSCGYEILQTSVPEAMLSLDQSEILFSNVENTEKYNAIGIGPGIGTKPNTQNGLKNILERNQNKKFILDADALNILALNPELIKLLPHNSIITPHVKEFERLFGKFRNTEDKIKQMRKLSSELNIIIVLKGANTIIASPDGHVYFNSTGNCGMATAGSGDVLTGIILSLLAQSYSPIDASLLGVFIHGLAGDYAKKKLGIESLNASDITKYLPKAFKKLRKQKK